MQKILSARAPDGCYNDSGHQKGSQPQETDCGISGKSIVENAAATHGSPECNPSRSERAHAFRECGGVSQIERTILFRPSFRVTPVSFSGRHFSQHPSSVLLLLQFVFSAALFPWLPIYLPSFPPLFSDTKHHRRGMLTLLSSLSFNKSPFRFRKSLPILLLLFISDLDRNRKGFVRFACFRQSRRR